MPVLLYESECWTLIKQLANTIEMQICATTGR